jgi:hypothetical protein
LFEDIFGSFVRKYFLPRLFEDIFGSFVRRNFFARKFPGDAMNVISREINTGITAVLFKSETL